MKRVLLLSLITIWSMSYFGQSLVSISQSTAYNGDAINVNVTGSSNLWTLATPTVRLYNSFGDTIDGSNIFVNTDDDFDVDFVIPCNLNQPGSSFTLKTDDSNAGILTLGSAMTIDGLVIALGTVTNELCNGSCDGSAAVNISNGQGPLNYSWTGGQTTATAVGLCAGSYNVTVIDANACSEVLNAVVTSPPLLTTTSSFTNVLCNGSCDGTAMTIPSGGTGSLMYNWTPTPGIGQGTANISALCPGTYTVTVTDDNGCTTMDNVSITEPTAITLSTSTSDEICFGSCDGSAMVTPSGGTPTYTYSWSPSPGAGQGTNSPSAMCATTYTVTVTDGNGCTAVDNPTISSPTVLSMSGSVTDVSCFGGNNGSIILSAIGGTAPYNYSIDGGATYQSSATYISLSAGSYNCIIIDANGCSTSSNYNITEPAILSTFIDTYTNPTCASFCDGTAHVNVSGGVGPYNYSWSPSSQTTASASTLCAGTHTVTITDNNGCVINDNVSLVDPTAVFVSSLPTNIACNGDFTGGVDITVTGGNPTYTFVWSGPNGFTATSEDILSVEAGAYTVTVTDASGCTGMDNVTLTQPNALLIQVSTTMPACFGASDGSATLVAVNGGTPTYNYSWTSGGSGLTETGLSTGTYTVTVTDANGCVADSTFFLNEPAEVSYSTTLSDPLCNGGSDGSISFSAMNGSLPYEYSIDNGATYQMINSFTNLIAGSYDVFVRDANLCTVGGTEVLNQPTVLGYTASTTDPSCFGFTDGVITFSSFGGIAPYQFSADNGSTFQSSSTIAGLAAGSYSVQVIDANGCLATGAEVLNDPPNTNFTVSLQSPTSCTANDGVITLSGLTPSVFYDFSLVNSNGLNGPVSIPASAGGQITTNALAADDYTDFSITYNGCNTTDNTIYTLTNPTNGLAINNSGLVITNANCTSSTGAISGLTITGGTSPYSMSYNGNSVASLDLASVLPGSYSLSITDNLGCITTGQYVVNANATFLTVGVTPTNVTCNSTCDGTLTANVTGGSSPYIYSWSNGMSGAAVTGVCAGSYALTVTDVNGCHGQVTSTITQPAAISATVVPVAPSCGINNGTLTVTNTSGGTAPFNYQWTNGDVGTTADSLGAGVYALTVTDANACQQMEVFSVASSSAPVVSASTVSPTCYEGNNGSIALSVSGGVAPYTYDWSTGHTTQNVSNLVAGYYDVTVTDATGCAVVQLISLADALPLDISGYTTTPSTCGNNDGSITVNPTGGAGGYTYLWNAGATTATISGIAAGTYECIVYDANGCEEEMTYALSDAGSPVLTVDMVVQPTCMNGTGEIYTSTTGGTAPYTYAWDNGDQTDDLFNAAVGVHNLEVTDALGCTGAISEELDGINLSAAEICMVTVDTTSGGNTVIWGKEYGLGIAEYQIFKESSVLNHFQLIGTVPFDSLSSFTDTAANSSIHSYRYKLRTIDSCANFSDFLSTHKTIHLVSNLGLSNVVNLSWDDYIGFTYSTFYIHRNHPSTGWELIDSVASNIHTYTDAGHPGIQGLEYSIVVVPDVPCTAEKAQDHNSTRSNKAAIAAPSGTDGVETNESTMLTIWPNPNSGLLNLNIAEGQGEIVITIHDLNGRRISSYNLNGGAEYYQLDLHHLDDGVYFIDALIKGENHIVKFVKQ
ncbi:MAG: T9SS type A sorting domain-containing protein [Flavobacteriales bacterium]|nr:T9SS type A sorting domain-containing protein [Flavobacteriales bacterium]MCB9198778.1 T9SS type A sorting domain-containing protein [Flavobacteriales bacterium]